MKNIICILLLLWILPLAACQLNEKQKAVALNDMLEAINKELHEKGASLGGEISTAMTNGDFSGIQPKRRELEQFISTSISKVEQAKDVGGSAELRSKELEYLRLEQQIVPATFGRFEAFNTATTEAEMVEIVTSAEPLSNEESRLLYEFRELQKAYAEKNKFTVAEK